MKKVKASLALLIPLLVQGVIEIGKIVVALIQAPGKAAEGTENKARVEPDHVTPTDDSEKGDGW